MMLHELFITHCTHNSDEEKSAENAVQTNLSGILTHKGRGVAIPSDNGTEFKKVFNETCDQLGIKRLFSNQFHPQGNA